MSLARGTMQIGRINVYPTTTTLVSISPSGSANCGDVITFTVNVSNDRAGGPTPTGIVRIKDANTGAMISVGAYASLSGGSATINTTLSNGSIQAYAEYDGVFNQFASSISSPSVLYSVNIISTTTTILNSADDYFCSHSGYHINAHVSSTVGITSGTMIFNSYTDESHFTTIGSGSVNGFGNASILLPADYTVPGNTYYLQAIYQGSGCFGVSASTPGLGGTRIYSIDSSTNATSTTTSIVGSSTFCIHDSITLNASITSAYLGNPSAGQVTWIATQGATVLSLGTDTSVSSGSASITVPGDTFPSTGSWTVVANYTGNSCYADSFSTNLILAPSTFSVSMFKTAGTTNFCYATSQIWTYSVSSIGSGTISGTFSLKSSLGNTLATTTTSGSASGFAINMSIPALTASDGSQNFYLEFTPTIGSCYTASNSSNTAVVVTSFLSQTPSLVVLGVTPSTGYNFTTFTFTITVYKGSGVGPLDGAGSLNGAGTLYVDYGIGYTAVNNNIHIFDNGTYGSGSYSTSGFSVGTANFIGRYNGNLCYGEKDSTNVPVVIQTFVH